jgi:polyhydroxyalkanoate synthesis repressor PhaR
VESRYVTLDEIAEMVKAGTEVRIIDNRSKEDLTSVTLAQIIFEEEKKTSKMSLRTLKDLIRHGGERAAQIVEDTQAELRGRVEAVRQAAEQRVRVLIDAGQQTSDRAKEMVAASQEAVAQFQRRVDDRVRTAVDGMANLSEFRRDINAISDRLAEIERKLAELEKR